MPPPGGAVEKEKSRKKKHTPEVEEETQLADVPMADASTSQTAVEEETQVEEDTQVEEETQLDAQVEEDGEIEWPPSPQQMTSDGGETLSEIEV